MRGFGKGVGGLKRPERRSFLLGAFGVLCAAVVLAYAHVTTIDRTYRPADAPGILINVNTADLDALALLEQIGPERAARIIEYRTVHGPFRNYPDLLRVNGIGQKTVQGLLGQVCFSD